MWQMYFFSFSVNDRVLGEHRFSFRSERVFCPASFLFPVWYSSTLGGGDVPRLACCLVIVPIYRACFLDRKLSKIIFKKVLTSVCGSVIVASSDTDDGGSPERKLKCISLNCMIILMY